MDEPAGKLNQQDAPFWVFEKSNGDDGISSRENCYMNDSFEKKVRAAAVAGWWVILAALGFVVWLWLMYLAVLSYRPEWVLAMWGPGITWSFVQDVWFWAVAGVKFCVWFGVFVVLWLTLWAQQLRKMVHNQGESA